MTMFRRNALALAASFVLAACSDADPNAPPPRPALWEVTDAQGGVEGWLFGTIHALPDDVEWRTPLLDRSLEQADALVVEVANLDDGARLAQLFEGLAFDRAEPPLARRIDPRHAGQLAVLMEEAGAGSARLDAMESWAAALSLAQLAQTGKSENGVDRALIADFSGREVVEIEGAGAQLAIFDSLPVKEQRDLLAAVLDETAAYDEDIGHLANAWRAGDTDRLTALTRRGILADPELRAALLTARNRAWAGQLENLLSTEAKPFVAVGAGHLLGAEGLPALLEARGYRVRRVQ